MRIQNRLISRTVCKSTVCLANRDIRSIHPWNDRGLPLQVYAKTHIPTPTLRQTGPHQDKCSFSQVLAAF